MNEQELLQQLNEIRNNLDVFDGIIHRNIKTGVAEINERQVNFVQKLLHLFVKLEWQLEFNNYKELKYEESEAINQKNCGMPVKIRSCIEGHGAKTYFGIYLGKVALSISHSLEDNIVTAKKIQYNPAIFVPELSKIIYGYQSWWGEIKSEEELKELITDDVINNVWYVKMLKNLKDHKND